MRIVGIILIIAGIIMLVINGFNFQTTKEVADIGPLEINKTENNRVAWPSYTGVVVAVLGIGLVALGGNKKAA